MKNPALLSVATAGMLCLVMCANSDNPAPVGPTNDAAWLDQLAGRWEGDLGGQRYVEEWHKVDASTYDGTSVTYSGEKAESTEQLRLTLFAGHWLYLANPGGQGVTCFARNSADATTWVFENKEHDFPKRIGYQLAGDGLTAWIAGTDDKDHRMEFVLKRMK